MTTVLSHRWLVCWLYRLTLLVAASIGLLVLAAPLLTATTQTSIFGKVSWLFAHDATVRKAAVASAIGLWVTAVVFFRSQASEPHA